MLLKGLIDVGHVWENRIIRIIRICLMDEIIGMKVYFRWMPQ